MYYELVRKKKKPLDILSTKTKALENNILSDII